ncbi:hypothetical protein D1007_55526 [Hordeum vulgare]|nr:hypothetical protein D1007_55526 [Hordeum vulgare]
MWCASAAGSTSELAGASVDAAPVRRPASFFFAFELPEPSAAFFFADVFPFFDPAVLGASTVRRRHGTAPARRHTSAWSSAAARRGCARPTVGGAPAVAAPTPAALGFFGDGGGGLAAVLRGEWGAGLCVHGGKALAPARAVRRRKKEREFARALESAARGSERSKLPARDKAMDSAPN